MSKRKITNSQAKAIVELLSDDSHSAHYLRVELTKNIIPHLFEEKIKLEVGKWYVSYIGTLSFYSGKDEMCGISTTGNWHECVITKTNFESCCKGVWNLATEEEVKEALTKEAVKRGFVEKAYIKSANETESFVYIDLGFNIDYKEGKFWMGGFILFRNGKWAEIIPTITKAEAEKKLGMKII